MRAARSLIPALVFFLAMAARPAAAAIGAHGGLNVASSSQAGSSSSTKFLFGGFLESQLIAALYLRPEVNWVKYGPDLGYVTVPILFELRSPIGRGAHVFVPAGFGLNFNTSEPAGTDYQSLFLALTVGGGLEFELSDSFSLTTSVRYELGLTDAHASGFKLRALQALAGLRYDL